MTAPEGTSPVERPTPARSPFEASQLPPDARPCVIFNPAARGERAKRFHHFLSTAGGGARLMPTTCAGAARALAREAIAEGYDLLIAAGGDGTVFEVLNGIADVPDALSRVTLGVLPLGTANVLACELQVPLEPKRAWKNLTQGRVRRVDCGFAQYADTSGVEQKAHFVIVAGAGLDARAIQLVDWNWKKATGKLAYIMAALRAFLKFPDAVRCTLGGVPFKGCALLAGNGRLYAGDIPVFADGALDSGRLHVRGVEAVTAGVLWRCLLGYATRSWPLAGRLASDAVTELRLESDRPVPLQLDGEFVGWLPATIRILPGALRLLTP